jgi:hypothetical protein
MTLLKYELLILFPVFAQFLVTQPLTPFRPLLNCAAQVKTASCEPTTHLSGGDGLGVAGTTLAAGKVLGELLLGGLLNNLGALSEDHLNVAGVGHVRVDLRVC